MTDTQFTALLAVLGTFGAALIAALKWAVTRITKALDDNTAVHREGAQAQLDHATAMAVLSTKIDGVSRWVEDHTPVDNPVVHLPSERGATPGRGVPVTGYGPMRPPTHGDRER